MEIVLAVLLLLGGFTLGSITADEGDKSPESSVVASNKVDVRGSQPHIHAAYPTYSMRCRSDNAVIYRDLTLPTHVQRQQPVTEARVCEGACPDE